MVEVRIVLSEKEAQAVLAAVKDRKESMARDSRHDHDRKVLEVAALKIDTSLKAVAAYESGYGKF